MVHIFFQRLGENPHLANHFCYNHFYRLPPISVVFGQLFPQNGGLDQNTQSYLDQIAKNFDFSKHAVPVKSLTYELATLLFHSLGLCPMRQENLYVFNFWLYMLEMYASIVQTSLENNFYREDHIFKFMSGFNMWNTRVVIVASDPSKNRESVGYAFHASPTPSVYQLLNYMATEMWLTDGLSNSHWKPLTVPLDELSEIQQNADLSGWINQGVLMLNSWLTYNESRWEEFTNYLVETLSDEMNGLVFILMGQVAFRKVPLLNYNKHLVLRVHHPSHNLYVNSDSSHLDWDNVLPFINANFWLYQTAHDNGRQHDQSNMIDWNSAKGGTIKSGWPARWQAYADLYDTAWSNMDVAINHGSIKTHVWDPVTKERALIVRRLPNGKIILKRHFHYELAQYNQW